MKKIALLLILSFSLIQCGESSLNTSTPDSNAVVKEKTNEQSITFACSDLNLKNLANAANSSDFKLGIHYTFQNRNTIDNAHLNTITQEFDRTTIYTSMDNVLKRRRIGSTFPIVWEYYNDYTTLDALVADATSKGLEIYASNLFYPFTNNGVAVGGYVPAFISSFANATQADKDNFKKITTDYIKALVDRYKPGSVYGTIKAYEVTNELFSNVSPFGIDQNNWLRKRFATDAEFTTFIGELFSAAKSANPDALLFYNDYKTEELSTKGTNIVNQINAWKTAGVPIDGYSLQFHVFAGLSKTSMTNALIKAATTGLQVHMSELDVSVNPSDNIFITTPTESMLRNQRTTFKQAVEAYKTGVPAAQQFGITFWDSTDTYSWFVKNGLRPNTRFEANSLYDKSNRRKPAYYGVAEGLSGTLYNTCVDDYITLGIKSFK